jgi:hypothetical protein
LGFYQVEDGVSETELDFSYNLEGVDRSALLKEAAQRLDALGAHMGGREVKSISSEGDAARGLLEDVAEFAGYPDVYKITEKDFLKSKFKVPASFSQMTHEFNFYWLFFPVVLFPGYNWAFNRLEMEIKMRSGDPAPQLQPTAYQILPNQQFQTLVKANTHLEVTLGENFEFSAKVPTLAANAGVLAGSAGAGVDVKAAAGAGMVLGPFNYEIKRAKIQHTTTGAERVFWRLDGAEFFQQDAPSIVIVARIPKVVKAVQVDARMYAYRYFNTAAAGLQSAISSLPKALRLFFEGNLPIGKPASWDLSPRL